MLLCSWGLTLSGCDAESNAPYEHTPLAGEGSAGEPPISGALTAGEPVGGEPVGGQASPTQGRLDGLPEPPLGTLQMSFPIAEADLDKIKPDIVIGVDHDPRDASQLDCVGHDGRSFPSCYDGHLGSDFMLLGGLATMDAGSALVVAAASGVVTNTHDGEYDRCHVDLLAGDVSCDGHPMRANLITIEHEGGWQTSYLHLKAGSLLVSEGERVSCGQPIALIGSSGYSTAPHLHLEVEDPFGRIKDPFAGERSQGYSLWVDEGARAEGEPLLPLPLCAD